MKWMLCMVMVMTLTLHGKMADAGQSIVIDADRQWAYAGQLFEQGDFSTAVVEYKRFVAFFSRDERLLPARYRIGVCLMRQELCGEALGVFNQLIGDSPSSRWAQQAKLRMAECYLSQQMPSRALGVLSHLVQTAHPDELRDEAFFRIGWIHLEAGKWSEARWAFEQIGQDQRAVYNIPGLLARLEAVGSLPQKRAAVAGGLAIVPGAGHLYSGRYRDAAVAFLLTTGLAVASWQAFETENHALGVLLGGLGVSFYSGSIYGAVSGVHKYNRQVQDRFRQQLRDASGGLRIGSAGNSAGVAVTMDFAF